jgi:hypothetical protein
MKTNDPQSPTQERPSDEELARLRGIEKRLLTFMRQGNVDVNTLHILGELGEDKT